MSLLNTASDQADRLYPEASTFELAMNDPQIDRDLTTLRDHSGMTEAQAAEVRKTHTTMLTGVISSQDAVDVHGAIVSGLTHPPVTKADEEARAKQYQADRTETLQKGREAHTWAWDSVFARAKQIVAAKPGLVQLLKDSGMENAPAFWMKVCERARRELKKEGKLGQ